MKRFAQILCLMIGTAPGWAALLPNGSFENGFPSSGSGLRYSFAGGVAVNLTADTPDGWDFTGGSGEVDRWVRSAAAVHGQHYVILSSANPNPNDDCLESKDFGGCWKKGETFRYSAFVAAASTSGVENRFNIEIIEKLSTGGSQRYVTSFDLAANPAWSDTALTAIPWTKVAVTHTFSENAAAVEFYISAAQDRLGGTSTVAVDNVSCEQIPEPTTLLTLGVAGLLVLRRRS